MQINLSKTKYKLLGPSISERLTDIPNPFFSAFKAKNTQ
jgi:hypothetical protein